MSDLRKAVQDFLTHWDSPQWMETAETVAAIAVMRKALAEPEQSEPVPSDGWLQDGSLLYRLTDESKPQNRDEINVTMADGSRSEASRTRRAGELLDRIRETRREPLSEIDITNLWNATTNEHGSHVVAFARAIEQAHGIGEKE